MEDELHDLIIYQSRYFEILTDFFVNLTGVLPRDFSSIDGFSEAVYQMGQKSKNDHKQSDKMMRAFSDLETNLKNLYAEEAANAFSKAKKINACKLNLGGSSRFLGTHLNATRKSLLYSDIVLIPDPVMPWIEKDRHEEKLNLINIIEAVFFILNLSDLTTPDFDIPPFFVFPSFEKSLEEHDPQTQENTIQLITDVFSHYVDSGITSPENIMDFAQRHPDRYFKRIEEAELFVPPGSAPGNPINIEIENYKAEMRQHRTNEWCEEMFSQGDTVIVTTAILERIQPNFHLLENSDELRSHPFLCIDVQAHYYQLIANMKNISAANKTTFDPSTAAILKSLTSHRLDYLANINDSQMTELRKTNENVEFRRELRDLVNSLSNTKVEDLGYVAAEVSAHIERVVSKHEKQVVSLNDKYAAKNKGTALMVVGAVAASMFPILAPFSAATIPVSIAAGATKYFSDRFDKNAEAKGLSHSMMGVISLAKNKR